MYFVRGRRGAAGEARAVRGSACRAGVRRTRYAVRVQLPHELHEPLELAGGAAKGARSQSQFSTPPCPEQVPLRWRLKL
ncbi:hypothetical protein GCM10027093_10780 [Paraburkholderia jirisanensis]